MIGPMEFQDVVRSRRMIRSYADRPVDPPVVERLLSNAVRAPSAGFTQGWAFLVLDSPGGRGAVLGVVDARATPRPSPTAG